MKPRRFGLDGAERRRIYLFRHGAVDYVREDGQVVDNPDDVPLSARGRGQAAAMSGMFANVTVDRAICSGLRRTRETAEQVLSERSVSLEVDAAFAEIRASRDNREELDPVHDVAFSHWRATEDGSRFLRGERYADFYQRIAAAIDDLTRNPDWHNLALFAHGGTNAAILGWTSGLGLQAFGTVDQATCCLNVLDFDYDAEGRIVRKVIRAMNVTADDPTLHGRHGSGMESLARRLLKFRS